ncbi:MAG: hypothetical protein ACRYG5_02085 [Janthinobacterium lividum]
MQIASAMRVSFCRRPNAMFTRDNSCWINQGVVLGSIGARSNALRKW